MAKLKCSCCGSGIYYHSEANGTEYIFIQVEAWEEMKANGIDALDENDYLPNLNPKARFEAWRCLECGTFHLFDEIKITRVKAVYKPAKLEGFEAGEWESELYIGFVDLLWDEITEVPGFLVSQVEGRFEGYFFMRKGAEQMAFYADRECTKLMACFERIAVGV